jgi:hypothetical protein
MRRINNFVVGILLLSIASSCNQKEKIHHNIFRYNETAGIGTLDPAFAKNASAQLNWVYKQSPYYEPAHNRYPVYRILK